MSKKDKATKGSNNLKILIFNIIIAALCVVSIVTLYVGDFLDAKISLNIDKETIRTMMGQQSAPSNSGIKAAEGAGEGMDLEEILKYVDDDFKLNFNLDLTLNGQTVAKGAVGQTEEAVKELFTTQVNNLVDEISGSVDKVINVSVKAVVKMAIEKAKEAIRTTLKEEMAKQNVTESELDEELKKEGTSLAAVTTMLDGFVEKIGDMLEGNTQSCADYISTNTTLRTLARIVAKDELKGTTPSDEEIEAKTQERIDELLKAYNEMIEKFSVEGEFSSETIIISLLNGTGLMDEAEKMSAKNAGEEEGAAESGSEEKKFKNMDDVKKYIVDKIMSVMGEETVNMVGKILSYVGYFLFFVMACWAYVLIKVIVKSIFFKNKTVGLFFPRMFGWMPHVFLVGLPMLLIKNIGKVAEIAGSSAGESVEQFKGILNSISVSVSSLTWISALCSVILLVLLFFYYPMRRQAKKERKGK